LRGPQPATISAGNEQKLRTGSFVGDNWLDVLKVDNRAIFTAVSHAQRAADFINGLQPDSAA
jgi:antirestriction protein ArdC